MSVSGENIPSIKCAILCMQKSQRRQKLEDNYVTGGLTGEEIDQVNGEGTSEVTSRVTDEVSNQ